MRIRIIFLLWIFSFSVRLSPAQVVLPRLVSDGMVLQQGEPVDIWGWAEVGEPVRVDFMNQSFRTVADENGEWKIILPEMKAGGPYQMIIEGKNTIEINDILIGEVWICSGQSNMELPVYRVAVAYPGLMENAENPYIRHFGVSTTYRFEDESEDFETGEWLETNPENIPDFSAVGYFFANALYERYKVPVGLIRIAVGGSPAEAWLSEDAIRKYPDDYRKLQYFKDDSVVDSIRRHDAEVVNKWNRHLDSHDEGLQGDTSWVELTDYDSWTQMELPGLWNQNPFQEASGDSEKTNGVIWLKKEVTMSSEDIEKPALLVLGALVDRDEVFINGHKAGSTGYRYPPRRYPVGEGILKQGKNVITVRLVSNSGPGGFVPDKFYGLVIGTDTIDLSGSWSYKIGYASEPLPGGQVTFHYQPSGLYNALVAPLKNFKTKGVIWYQGESNVGDADKYKSLFRDLIADWRKNIRSPDLPFLYVQLANFLEPRELPCESEWAELREAQRQALEVAGTGMAVTIDIGEWNDIHPLDKETVGERLALAARKRAYGEKELTDSGPLFKEMRIEKDRLLISFSETGGGLRIIGNDGLKEIAVAGEDGKFYWAEAEIKWGKLVVWSKDVPQPVAVRYAWADNPDKANLYNEEGLPASPFCAGE